MASFIWWWTGLMMGKAEPPWRAKEAKPLWWKASWTRAHYAELPGCSRSRACNCLISVSQWYPPACLAYSPVPTALPFGITVSLHNATAKHFLELCRHLRDCTQCFVCSSFFLLYKYMKVHESRKSEDMLLVSFILKGSFSSPYLLLCLWKLNSSDVLCK